MINVIKYNEFRDCLNTVKNTNFLRLNPYIRSFTVFYTFHSISLVSYCVDFTLKYKLGIENKGHTVFSRLRFCSKHGKIL